ncbi:DUF2726 domain-containing protein [Novosphingobium decolorationis]|uniref:DUF2726 domain-containing protein n=1 Tax=Novosphingobium decolorationis TaxID=2698673 RepID=A0ABX8EA03_9SPHN|nr:DUF2726 domain-containing protein [Novosphingobium decolorationis]MED5543800.1 DUF2726 domain-containing protein [Pseudomonadota bacterium]QVM85001.1 DUF2726 domain-containing protein [Novosphingobium decolorationis]
MPDEILALIDKPHLLIAVLAIGGVLGMAVERFVESSKRAERRAYWQKRKAKGARFSGRRKSASKESVTATSRVSATEQLDIVMDAEFSAQPLLNRPERRLMSVLDACVREGAPDWRVMAQVSMGEIVRSDDEDAYFAVNSKRVDLLVVNDAYEPLHAIEFQGTGHHLGRDAAARDAVKREALRKAGIGYVEVASGDSPSDVRLAVAKLLRQSGRGDQA